MATTVIQICNAALSRIGEAGTVTNVYPPEGSAEAEYCAQYYPIAVQSLLSARNWGFARRVQGLSELAKKRPTWQHAFAFPEDCLILRDVVDDGATTLLHEVQYSGARKMICTNTAPANAVYTAYIQDPAQFPFLFVDAITWKLAAMLAGSVIKGMEGVKMGEQCERYALTILQSAMLEDANQARHRTRHTPEWLKGR